MEKIQYENLTIRQAEASDAKQLAAWWNDGAVMAHAGFPNGVGTTEAEVIKGLGKGSLVIEENHRLIGECNYRDLGDGVAEIGIKICEPDGQNRLDDFDYGIRDHEVCPGVVQFSAVVKDQQ